MAEFTGTVIDFDYKGRGITKKDGVAVFLNGGIIGDEVKYEITKQKKNWYEGKIIKILKESNFRKKSPCKYSKKCGGCDFLELPYEIQKEWKRKSVLQQMKRIAKLELDIEEVISSSQLTHYRNHMQFQVKNGRIGLYGKNSKDLVEIESCLMQSENSNRVLQILKHWKKIRHLDLIGIRSNEKDEIMLILVSKQKLPKLNDILPLLLDAHVVSIYENINSSKKYHYSRSFTKIFGKDQLEEKLLDLQYELSPNSFYQVNRRATEQLYKKAFELLQPSKDDILYDLYCGIGTISLSAAPKVKEVIGVEIIPEAIENARNNAIKNGIENVRFMAGSAEEIIPRLWEEENILPDCIILDPPRAGLDRTLIEFFRQNPVKKILYISCNSATQARDLTFWRDTYHVEEIIGVDLFPNTVHVETIVLMSRE